MQILLLIGGLILTVKGGSWLVTGASKLARQYGLSELVIGLTIVAFGTSLPEFVVSFVAALNNHSDIAVANVIGSNNFNLFVILGICGLIMPISIQKDTIRKEIPISFFAALLVLLLGNNFFFSSNLMQFSRLDGILLLILFSLFLFYVFRLSQKDVSTEMQPKIVEKRWKPWLFVFLGLVLLILGGQIAVNAAVNFARAVNVSEKMIGITILAIGTSLPELVASVVAMRKKNVNIAIGNVVGSNIFNVLLILGAGSVINPMTYSPSFNLDVLFLMGGTLILLLAMFTGQKRRLDRWESLILLLGYGVWLLLSGF